MANYDFSSLNSSDLEDLVRDLLNAQEQRLKSNIRFKTFKDGKDKGIDLLHSTNENPYEIVGQVKHYFRSGYDLLLKGLLKSERSKIERLKPAKYILATSVDLSIINIEEIFNSLYPYIKNLTDIYGRNDLNRLLENYPDIVKNHFKLWYSSTTVLSNIINYSLIGRSNEFKENDVKRRLRLFVKTPFLDNARAALKKNNFVIMTGDPGVGKTTTAELLLYEYLLDGYELTYIYDKIKEAENVLTEDDKKQIFYFDDFLGQNSYEIQKAKGSESALINILRRISRAHNKKFIFTTRTFILKSAIEESERLRQFNLKTKESTFQLTQYTQELKIKLLENHIDESEIPSSFKFILEKESIKQFIANHPNFSPRSIEFITTLDKVEGFSANEYEEFVKHNFNTPDEIWRHAYEQQIIEIDQFLLNTIISFGNTANLNELEIAFNARLDYEVEFNNYKRPMNAFRNAFRRLEGGFIISETYDPNIYKFINPSLADFLIKYLQNNLDEVIRISESAVFYTQLTTRLFPLYKGMSKYNISKKLEKKILFDTDSFISINTEEYNLLTRLLIIYNYLDINKSENIICEILLKINKWGFLINEHGVSGAFFIFLKEIESPKIITIIKNKGIYLFAPLIFNEYDINDSILLLDFIKSKYIPNLQGVLIEDKHHIFDDHLTNLLNDKIEYDIEDLLGNSNAQDLIYDKEKETKELQNRLMRFGLYLRPAYSKYWDYNWLEIGTQNYIDE